MLLLDLKGVRSTDRRTEHGEGGATCLVLATSLRTCRVACASIWDTRGLRCGHWPLHRHGACLEDASGLEAGEARIALICLEIWVESTVSAKQPCVFMELVCSPY